MTQHTRPPDPSADEATDPTERTGEQASGMK
jgi:hypothetical protein